MPLWQQSIQGLVTLPKVWHFGTIVPLASSLACFLLRLAGVGDSDIPCNTCDKVSDVEVCMGSWELQSFRRSNSGISNVCARVLHLVQGCQLKRSQHLSVQVQVLLICPMGVGGNVRRGHGQRKEHVSACRRPADRRWFENS